MDLRASVASSQVASTGGRKFDGGKPMYGLLPSLSLEETVKVLTFGANKYEPGNWKRVPDGKNRYFDAMQRHLWAWHRGEVNDPESGLHHLAHAICCAMFICELDLLDKKGHDEAIQGNTEHSEEFLRNQQQPTAKAG